MWLVSPTRRLLLLLAVLSVGADAAVAQVNVNRMRQHSDKSVGTSIDDAVKQLSSDDPEKRLEAVKVLGTLKDSKAIDYLIKAVGDPDVRVQAKSIQMLGDIRATESTPALVQCLILRTTYANMKQLVLASLGKIGDARAVPPMIDLLRRERDAATRGAAIFALGDIGAPESIDVVEHIAQTDEDPAVRRVATEAKSKIEAHNRTIRGDAQGPSEVSLEPPKPRQAR